MTQALYMTHVLSQLQLVLLELYLSNPAEHSC